MPYATTTDVQAALGDARYLRLVDRDRDGSADAGEVAALDAALDAASSVADSYIRRYLPLTATPPSLRRAVIALAVFDMDATPTEAAQKKYNDALQWLRDIGKGNAELDVVLAASADTFLISAPDALFDFEGPLP